jgi:uncharacterized protein YyaL (SSP411 family)
MPTSDKPMVEPSGHTNALISESSPYLLQHAHNPVDWYPWGEEAFDKAKAEDKPVLISVGYSACHWCHVMERESFEDSTVADLMNEHFICIKVDREERPDVDQVYMEAVQLMTGRGGWPLNCFTMPEGRPFYGGTYFPKDQWISVLQQLSELYKNDRQKVEEYAAKLSSGISQRKIIAEADSISEFSLEEGLGKWKQTFDMKYGGPDRAPKFPMPNNLQFALHYLHFNPDEKLKKYLTLTLDKMAEGGIYDQLGGGFARYSTDKQWKVPHFEKMLYDNAQLIQLYSEAYKVFKTPLYKKVVEETIEFLQREMLDASGAFYSAYDADSEGEEGKFYVWKKEELKSLLTEKEYELAKATYNINNYGYWEHDNYVLIKNKSEEESAKTAGLSLSDYQKQINTINKKLFEAREKRIKPGLDDKSLTSWNALTTVGLLEAYEAFGKEEYLELAEKNIQFILNRQWQEDGSLLHSYKAGKSSINGFLEDYCFTIQALIKLYEATFNGSYLKMAEELCAYTLNLFYDDEDGLFYFTAANATDLFTRPKETEDNVIPASNSVMANNLYTLGKMVYNPSYIKKSSTMLDQVKGRLNEYLPYYSNWAQLHLKFTHPFHEVAIVGDNAFQIVKGFSSKYLPNSILLGSEKENNYPELLAQKFVADKTMIYVCETNSCKKPVDYPAAAFPLLTE